MTDVKKLLSLLSLTVFFALFSVSAMANEPTVALDDWCEIETVEMTDTAVVATVPNQERMRLSPGAGNVIIIVSFGETALPHMPSGGTVASLAATG